jgi:hypothetical protein
LSLVTTTTARTLGVERTACSRFAVPMTHLLHFARVEAA